MALVDGAVSSGVLPVRLEFQTGTSGAGRATQMTIKSNGNVLINTTTDAGYKLDVNGTARVQGALTATGNFLAADVTDWVDYSATSTIAGFTTYTTKKIQYRLAGPKTLIVQYQIEGSGTNTTHSFTIPYNASTWGTQYFMCHALNNNTTQSVGVVTISASSNVVTCSNTTSTSASWINATNQAMRGTITINIA
jgi:hypothetical protein